jgi:hypothetical protein
MTASRFALASDKGCYFKLDAYRRHARARPEHLATSHPQKRDEILGTGPRMTNLRAAWRKIPPKMIYVRFFSKKNSNHQFI